MNTYELSVAGVNVAEGIRRFNGNAEVYEKFVQRFTEDENFDRLCVAVSEKNVQGAFAAAHALKGLAGNLSMTTLFRDMVPLVEELRAGSLAQADALLAQVSCDYNAVVSALQA